MDAFYKTLAVALKDIQVFLKDRTAALTMILLPVVIGAFTAAMNSGGQGSIHLPVVVVNQDAGAYGESIVKVLCRGGTLTDSDHRLLALWAAACAEHVMHLFESMQPSDPRPRQAIEQTRAWVRGEITMSQARAAAGAANAAASELSGAARHAAHAAGQAAAVAHVAAHELGAAAYAIKAARAAAPEGEGGSAGRLECRWQREQLPDAIRELVLDDQRLRNEICWSVFDC